MPSSSADIVCILLQYRLVNDYTDSTYLGPRCVDKLFVGLLMLVLYHSIGRILTASNVTNISALLFMWATLPGFTAVTYVSSICAERALLRRCLLKYSHECFVLAAFLAA